jgi:hypothetical protein
MGQTADCCARSAFEFRDFSEMIRPRAETSVISMSSIQSRPVSVVVSTF